MERRDVYQDDLTENRQPSPSERDDVVSTQPLDPDGPSDGESQQEALPEHAP